jgi:hypothetical protein
MKTNDHNKELYRDMQEEPNKYSDQEIEAMMDDLDQVPDVDEAWQQFKNEEFPRSCVPSVASEQSSSASLRKMAASFVGLLLVSGIAFAAIQIVRYAQQHTPKTEEVINTPKPASTTPADTLPTDTTAVSQPIIYDNIPLEKMLPEIAAHYDVKVTFANEEVHGLRFRFVWNPQQGIDQVVSDLNQFERLTVTLKDKEITVE